MLENQSFHRMTENKAYSYAVIAVRLLWDTVVQAPIDEPIAF